MVEQEGTRDDSVVGDVTAVFGVLQRLLRERELDRGIEGIDISVGSEGPGVAYGKCTVKIKADNAAHKEEIKKKFPESEGWTCTDKPGSDTESTCVNP